MKREEMPTYIANIACYVLIHQSFLRAQTIFHHTYEIEGTIAVCFLKIYKK